MSNKFRLYTQYYLQFTNKSILIYRWQILLFSYCTLLTVILILNIYLQTKDSKCPPPTICPVSNCSIKTYCSEGYFGVASECYLMIPKEATWENANSYCKNMSSKLMKPIVRASWLKNSMEANHFWVDVKRNSTAEPWPLLSGNQKIRGEGVCAYYDNKGLSSTVCTLEKTFICQKSVGIAMT